MAENLVQPIFVTTELEGVLSCYVRRNRNLSMETITQGLITAIDDYIQNEGDGSWEPFRASTLRRHPRRRGGQLLQDSGLLANIQPSPDSPGPDWVQVESPAPYGWHHVEGTRNMDARNYLAVDLGQVLEQAAEQLAVEVAR